MLNGSRCKFGWIHVCCRQLISRKHGRDTWLKILTIADFEEGLENEMLKNYTDEETFRLIKAMAEVVEISIDEVWEALGGFFIQFTMETGWNEILRALSPSSQGVEGFLDALDSMHYFIDHIVYQTKLKGPSFRCEVQSDGSLWLHYYSKRSGLYPIVKGAAYLCKYSFELCSKFRGQTNIPNRNSHESGEKEQELADSILTEHIIFSISLADYPLSKRSGHNLIRRIATSPSISINDNSAAYSVDLALEHVGVFIQEQYPWLVCGRTKLTDVLELAHPEIIVSFESILAFRNSPFIFRLKPAVLDKTSDEFKQYEADSAITVRGSMHAVDNKKFIVYMCSLNLATVGELKDRGLTLANLSKYDVTRDLIMLNQQRRSQVEWNKTMEEATRSLKTMSNELEAERHKTEELLCELMPKSIAGELLAHLGKSETRDAVEAREFPEATVLFTDIVTFTNICSHIVFSKIKLFVFNVVHMLNDLYLRFDRLVGLHDVYKVETIGDAYMIVGGVPKVVTNHAENVLNMSIAMLMESKLVLSPITSQPIRIRVGLHTGHVVAGVVGIKMPRYCLFGETVANKMESNGIPGRIHLSESTKRLGHRTNSEFVFTDRGNIEIIVGSGIHYTYFLERNNKRSVWELCGREPEQQHSANGYAELHAANPHIEQTQVVVTEKLSEKQLQLQDQQNGSNLANGARVHDISSKACILL
uniref:guanylate cyclase n=1 Tax=Ditylenchus dipsaci TaxID=166011 RepID=A0A915CU54_9BILA